MPAPDELPSDLTNVVWDALSKRVRTLSSDLAIEPKVADDLIAELHPIAAAPDPLLVARQLIRDHACRARQVLQLIEGLSAEVEVQEKRRAWLARFTEEWWRPRRVDALNASNPAAARQAWLQAFVDALLAGEYEACLRWTELELPPPVASSLPLGPCRFVSRALAAGRFAEARPILEELASASESSGLLDATSRGELLAFVARIHLFDLGAPGNALRILDEAVELAPQRAAISAVRSDYHAKLDQPDLAAEYAQAAIQCDPDAPEGFVALGAWAEGRQRWAEARDHYDRVGKLLREHSQPWRSLGRLRTKFSGLAALRVARKLAQAQRCDLALEGVNQAIALGITDEGEYPEVEAYELKSEVLASLKKPAAEIAETLYQAGRRRYWRRESSAAMELFRRAIEQNPDLSGPHWFLADALLAASETKQPPFADAARVAEAAREWDQTAERHALEPGMSWPYVTGALICGQRALLPGENKTELWWRAVSRLECAVLLAPSDAQNWAHLGRYFGLLLMEASALQVTARALEVSPGNALVLNQRATILADTGRYAEAEAAINERLKAEPDAVWERGVKAFILFYQHRYAEALELVNAVIEKAPEEAWHRDVRALCWRGVEREDKAREDYVWLVEKWRSTGQSPDLAAGWAALNIGELRTGFEILDSLCRDPATLTSTARSFRGLAALALNELETATADLQEGARLAINLRETQLMIETGLPWAEKESARWPHGESVRPIIARTREQLLARQREITVTPRSSQAELREALAGAGKPGDDPRWVWIGAQAALARLEMDHAEARSRKPKEGDASSSLVPPSMDAAREHWREAGRIYAQLLPWQKRFFEAGRGLRNAQARLLGAADDLWRESKTGDAEAGWRDALSLSPDLVLVVADARAEAHCRLALADAARQEHNRSRALFEQAIDDLRRAGEQEPGRRLARICQPLLRAPADYWMLLDVWRRWESERDTDAALRAQWSLAVGTLAPALETIYRVGPTNVTLPVVTPVAIEIGADLIPLAEHQDGPLLKKLIPEMRERLLQSMGWHSPGVRLRGNVQDLASDAYLIMLDEVPIVMGTLPAGMRFIPAAAQQVRAAGVPDAAFKEAANPADSTGTQKGCWVGETYAERLKALNLGEGLRREEYLIRHLEVLLRHSAVWFVGAQEVANLLEEWKKDESHGGLAAAFLADRTTTLRLRRILRALLVELVPITRWPVILEAVRDVELATNDILPLLCEVRRRLRDQLPGNEPGLLRVPLEPSQEQTLAPCLREEEGRWFLAIPPEETQNFLAHVRELSAQHGARFALVVQDPRLRVFVRRMVQLEFVGVMVLAAEELIEAAPMEASATFDDLLQPRRQAETLDAGASMTGVNLA